jgi:NAD(P)-dependent dehydrogenase (short-subunit alcohol dehydrogenase family)
VTGTSSGIGLHAAVGLARAGLRVVATLRDPAKDGRLRRLAGEAQVELDIRALDVTDAEAAAECVRAVTAEHGGIDVLVINAGRGHVATLEETSDADLVEQLEVNYLAVARLTRLVLPGMRAGGAGRVVTVTSVGGVVGQPFNDAYCGAKFAVEGLMQALAPVAARYGVQVCVVEPAAVSSDFVSNIDPALLGAGGGRQVDGPFGDLLAAYVRRTSAAFATAQTPQDAAAVVVEAATTSSPRFRWQTSPVARTFAGLSLADLDGSAVLRQTRTWLDQPPAG